MWTLIKKIHLKILKSPVIWIAIGFVAFFLAIYPGALTGTFGTNLTFNDVYVNSYREADILLKSQTSMAIILTGLIIFISGIFLESFVKINNSLFSKTIYLSSMPKQKYYIAIVIPIITYSFLFIFFAFGLLLIYDAIGLIAGPNVSSDVLNLGFETLSEYEKNIIEWSNVQWGLLIYAFTMSIAIIIIISIAITTFWKSSLAYSSIIWGYVFLLFFFTGASVPLPVIRDYSDILIAEEPFSAFVYISYLLPNTYSNFLFIDAFVGIADLNKTYLIINTIVPLVFFIIFLLLILIKKKWFNKN